MKKILMLIMLVGLLSGANASEDTGEYMESDYTKPIIAGLVVIGAGLATGGAAWVAAGVYAGVSVATATMVGGSYVITELD